jgi:large subunit ribosomal protein L27
MAHRKAGGSTQYGRDSISKRLGVKVFGGQTVNKGEIIIRQRGTKFRPGENTKITSDDTIIAMKNGVVSFSNKKLARYTGKLKNTKFVEVK